MLRYMSNIDPDIEQEKRILEAAKLSGQNVWVEHFYMPDFNYPPGYDPLGHWCIATDERFDLSKFWHIYYQLETDAIINAKKEASNNE